MTGLNKKLAKDKHNMLNNAYEKLHIAQLLDDFGRLQPAAPEENHC